MDDELRTWITLALLAAAILWGSYGRGSLSRPLKSLIWGPDDAETET